MSRYDPLRNLLVDQPGSVFEVTFGDLDAVVGGLPNSAYQYREWWSNGDSPQSRAWTAAGWRVDQAILTAERVRFRRTATRVRPASVERQAPPAVRAVEPTKLTTAHPGQQDVQLRVVVSLTWQREGEVTISAAGKLQFPRLPAQPGVYRIELLRVGQVIQAYLGESGNLARRARNYTTPSPSQQTSLRINTLLSEHLATGGTIDILHAADVKLLVDDVEVVADLSRKADRVLVEHAALAKAIAAGEPIANL